MIVAIAIFILSMAVLFAACFAGATILKRVAQSGSEEGFAMYHRSRPRMSLDDRSVLAWGSFIIAWASIYLMVYGFVGIGSVIFILAIINFVKHFVEMCIDMYADKVLSGEFDVEREQHGY